MRSTLPANAPIPSTGYVPYFYESGRFQSYHHAVQFSFRTGYPAPSDSYAPPTVQHAREQLDRFQTVEQVIANGYFATPGGEPVTAILTDKKGTAWLGLDDVIDQIRQRYDIYHRHMEQMECAKCAATNTIYAHEAYHEKGSADSRQHYARHKRIQELYEQQREERVNLWRDVSRLKLVLPELAQGYLSAHRKVSALDDTGGDSE